jgi:hypothetical protein
MGEWKYSSTVLSLGSKWRSVAIFMALLLSLLPMIPGTHETGERLVSGRKVGDSAIDSNLKDIQV